MYSHDARKHEYKFHEFIIFQRLQYAYICYILLTVYIIDVSGHVYERVL